MVDNIVVPYVSTTMENTIEKISHQYSALHLIGARQVGKTAVLMHLVSDKRTYVSLTDMDNRDMARANPKNFYRNTLLQY
ncbi:MAG: hypothetical protein LBR22_05470 [Desulfovibrio sp.]|nr:hypothetical protein [Desulfovibrio sp.]